MDRRTPPKISISQLASKPVPADFNLKHRLLAVNEITDKFEIYLQAGVKSCWLVIPPTKTVVLFHDMHHPVSCSTGQFADPIMGLEVSLEEIFA
mgnify:CR=1 FL=1